MKPDFYGTKIEEDNREKFIVCVSNKSIDTNNITQPLTIGKTYEHIPDDAIVGFGGVSGLRCSRKLYYSVEDDEGEIHNYYKKYFKPVIIEQDKRIVYIDMDGVLCDYVGAKRDALESSPNIIYPQSQHGFFTNLQPIAGAVASWYKLLYLSKVYDPYILTAPSLPNPMSYTEKRVWVERYLGKDAVGRLIISPRKDLSKGDFLIDDNLKGRGQDKFEGELIHFGSQKFDCWDTIITYLNNKI